MTIFLTIIGFLCGVWSVFCFVTSVFTPDIPTERQIAWHVSSALWMIAAGVLLK